MKGERKSLVPDVDSEEAKNGREAIKKILDELSSGARDGVGMVLLAASVDVDKKAEKRRSQKNQASVNLSDLLVIE